MRYYYADEEGNRYGPVEEAVLRDLRRQGKIGDDAWVVEEGGTDWKAYSAVFGGKAPPAAAGTSPPDTRRPGPGSQPPEGRHPGALATAVVGCVFGGIAAVCAVVGGACCCWIVLPTACVALALGIISLCLQRSNLGWVAMGLALVAIVWVIVSFAFLTAAETGASRVLVEVMREVMEEARKAQ
ncbi:GYF domain-containing protein [Verrucomicrobiota bacterium]